MALDPALSLGEGGETVVCTLGMHRSGTSLVSRMLNLLGLYLGPDEQISATGDDNPRGYWEHRSFVEINEQILARLGGRWDQPPPFPPAWACDPRLADLKEDARRLVAEEFGARPRWGWKDPRTCLTLPFWQAVVGPMRYVLCVRSPRAVMGSLTRRNGFLPEKGERLWLGHLQASLAHTSGRPRLLVCYEDVLDDWPLELDRLAAFLGDPERARDPRVREAVGRFVDDEMCHHNGSLEEVAGDTRVSVPALGLYAALRGGTSLDTLDVLGLRAVEAWDRTAALTAERDALAGESRAQRAALTEQGQALRTIQESRAWRLVLRWRGMAGRLLPPGSRRRRALDALLARLTS